MAKTGALVDQGRELRSIGIIPEGVPIRVDRIVTDGSPLIIQGHVTTPTGGLSALPATEHPHP